MQFALPAVVEQAECRVAALLNFGEHDAGADGVDGAGRDEDDVAFRDRAPLDEVGDRAVPDRGAQLLRRELLLQSDGDLRVRAAAERMYHASVLPFGKPIERANASSG